MRVSMNNTYYGYVEEIIKNENGKPTLQLRVRVPSIHGYKDQSNIKLEDLPIAEPIITPGTLLSSPFFVDMLEHVKEVIIMFKGGDINKPVYIGAVNNPELYQVRMDIATGGGGVQSVNKQLPDEDGNVILHGTHIEMSNTDNTTVTKNIDGLNFSLAYDEVEKGD